MKTISMSLMWSDKLQAALKKRSRDPFPIECHRGSEDFKAVTKAVNQGIDSHLEAIFFKQGEGTHGRVRLVFEAASIPVLVRRLMEAGDEPSDCLASGICGCLDIELI